ncbi:MAG TPA: hypothetical protein VH092_05760, partial [Urbifossiella sp.]|nr:hypothetical protein [Urbifossiella sp.]
EDPVTGVRHKPLTMALDLAASPGRKGVPVKVVGPNFSGSEPSLARAVQKWEGTAPGRQFDFISGCASGLKSWAEMDEKSPDKILVKRCGPAIRTTTIPVAAQRRAVLHYLSRPGGIPTASDLTSEPTAGRIHYARLVEGNTGFGASAGGARKDRRDVREDAGGPGKEEQKWTEPDIQVQFPLHVSRMAGVLAQEQRNRDEQLGIKPRGRLSLTTLDAVRAGGDLLPAADETRTAALNMERLEHDWGVIRRERIRYVEIVATDPRDRLFLIQLLRVNCPNVVPFTYEMDVLLGHPDYLPFTRGTVLATTYPLRPEHQAWAGSAGVRHREAFATNGIGGTYNAILAHLGRDERMIDYATPASDRTGDQTHAYPPVWVAAVGENGNTVPLAYFTNYPREAMYAAQPQEEHPLARSPPHRPGLRYLALGVIAAGVGAAVLIGRSVGRGGPLRPLVAGLRTMYATLAVGGVGFAALPLLLYFLTLIIQGNWHIGWADWLVTVGLGGVTVAFLAWVAYLFVPPALGAVGWAARQAGWRPGGGGPAPERVPEPAARPHGVWVLTAAFSVVGVVTFGCVWAGHGQLDPGRHWAFVERAAEADTGASPILPGLAFA